MVNFINQICKYFFFYIIVMICLISVSKITHYCPLFTYYIFFSDFFRSTTYSGSFFIEPYNKFFSIEDSLEFLNKRPFSTLSYINAFSKMERDIFYMYSDSIQDQTREMLDEFDDYIPLELFVEVLYKSEFTTNQIKGSYSNLRFDNAIEIHRYLYPAEGNETLAQLYYCFDYGDFPYLRPICLSDLALYSQKNNLRLNPKLWHGEEYVPPLNVFFNSLKKIIYGKKAWPLHSFFQLHFPKPEVEKITFSIFQWNICLETLKRRTMGIIELLSFYELSSHFELFKVLFYKFSFYLPEHKVLENMLHFWHSFYTSDKVRKSYERYLELNLITPDFFSDILIFLYFLFRFFKKKYLLLYNPS